MNKDFLALTACLLATIVIVIIVQTVIVTSLVSIQISGSAALQSSAGTPSTATQPPTGTTRLQKIGEEYIKPSATALGAILAAFIAGIFGYKNIMRQLRTSTRNEFVDMLVDNSTYRNQIESFLSAIHKGNFNDLKERMDYPALFYLFILKPKVKNQLLEAISKNDMSKVIELTRNLFTV